MEFGDDVNGKILGLLAVEPRASNKHIAAAVGISEVAVASRIRSLQADGVMRVVLQCDTYESSPNSIAAVVELYLERSDALAEAEAAIAEFEDVFSAYQSARRPEIILNCRSETPKALNALLMQLATTVPHLREMRTLPILDLGRYSTAIGTLSRYPGKAEKPRTVGDALVHLLQQDGRQSISSLARQLGLSITAARYRFTKLLSQPGMRIGLVCDSETLGYTFWFDMRLKIKPAYLRSAMDRFSGNAYVRVVAHLSGEANLLVFVLAKSVEEVDEFVRREIRGLEGLLDFTMIRVPRVFKFNYNYNL